MSQLCLGCMETIDDDVKICPYCGYEVGTLPLQASHLTPGARLLDRYIVGRVLGHGGFGVTYIGYDDSPEALHKKIAIKEYLPGEFSTRMPKQEKLTIYTGDKEEQFLLGKEKFIDEARRLAKFQNIPEVVHVYDCFEANDTAYIVMEFLDGVSLKEKLEKEGPMTVEQALPILLDVLHALRTVHSEGLLHRDVAPDNIYLTKDGAVKLLDFGAARFATTTHSRSLTVLIKQGFAPEEQYRSRGDQGTWTDVYAAAATFYKMITGVTPEDAMERAAHDTLKPPSKLGVKIGPNTEAALMNAMNTKVDGRTQTAEKFEEELMANVVKRVIVKKQKVDIGKFPLWAKVVAGSVVVGVLGFSALVASGVIRFQIAGWSSSEMPDGQTRVPNVVNEEMETAITRGEEAQLNVQINDRQYSNEVPENKVLSQNLRGGSIVNINDTLGIVISAGIEGTYVPNVIGYESEKGIQKLKDAGFVVQTKEEEYRAAPGTIGWQSLDPDTAADTGTQIEIIISKGLSGGDSSKTEIVDNLVGMDYKAAADQMAEKYLYLVKGNGVYSDTIPEGQIMEQDVKADSSLNQNSNIKVTVSLGKEMVTIPDVQYKTQADAEKLLKDSGLLAEIRQEASATVVVGNVTRQDRSAGERMEKGGSVVLYISTGTPPQNESKTQRNVNQSVAEPIAAPQTQPAVTEETKPQATQAPETKAQPTKGAEENNDFGGEEPNIW